MAYTILKDGGLHVYVGCASNWTGGTDVQALAHELKFGSGLNGTGSASFWIEVANPFDVSAMSYLYHGSRVNIYHTVDATTTYLYKGFIISDPKRGIASGTARVFVECGGPLEVAKWRTDCAFFFTDCEAGNWIVNKRNNKVYNVSNDDCLEIQVDKGEKVPSNGLGGIVGYVAYLGAQYMAGSNADNKFNAIKRFDGQVTTRLGDNMRAKLLVADSYTDSRNVNASAYTTIKTWGDTENERKLPQRYFDTNDFWTPPTDGKRYLALALYCMDVAGDNKVMTTDHFVRIDHPRVYSGTISRRIDEALTTIATWVGLSGATVTTNIRSVIPNLYAPPYCDPVSAMSQFALQAETLVEWGWWPSRSTNQIEFRARDLLVGEQARIDSGRCYTVDASVAAVDWDVRPRPEDGQGDVRAVRLVYGMLGGRQTDYPAGTPAAVIAPGDPRFSNALGPFQGSTACVPTVDFSGRNFSTQHARSVAKSLARKLRSAERSAGTVSARVTEPGTTGLIKSSTSTAFPWTYIAGGDFVKCSNDPSVKPLLVTSVSVDVDNEAVTLEVGMPADTLMRQLEAAGSVRRAKLHRK